jgi:hypothetical protein
MGQELLRGAQSHKGQILPLPDQQVHRPRKGYPWKALPEGCLSCEFFFSYAITYVCIYIYFERVLTIWIFPVGNQL